MCFLYVKGIDKKYDHTLCAHFYRLNISQPGKTSKDKGMKKVNHYLIKGRVYSNQLPLILKIKYSLSLSCETLLEYYKFHSQKNFF